MNKTLALLLDSYRELNAKRLFWIVLIISGLVIAGLACTGNSKGALTLLWWKTPVKAGIIWGYTPEHYYGWLFTTIGISIWLTWAANILALVSTASIFPDFMAGGSIDLYLSKPISRFRLFITKYIGGLLFVILQVSVFSLCSFFLMGIRGHSWQPRLFLAIPLVTLVFSYLYSICVLLGVLTRSTIAALLLTMLIWLALFGVQITEKILLGISVNQKVETRLLDKQIAQTQYKLDNYVATSRPATNESDPDAHSWRKHVPFNMASSRDTRASLQDKLSDMQIQRAQQTNTIFTLHTISYAVVTLLPKTQGATDLLVRALKQEDEPDSNADTDDEGFAGDEPGGRDRIEMRREMRRDMKAETDKRTTTWIVGTSVAFEIVMLSLAGWIFCRRDY